MGEMGKRGTVNSSDRRCIYGDRVVKVSSRSKPIPELSGHNSQSDLSDFDAHTHTQYYSNDI
jgi:hypothetical protein